MTDLSEALKLLLATGAARAGVALNATPTSAILNDDGLISAVLAVPEGINASDVTDKLLARLPTPRRRKGHLTMLSPTSLIDYVNRYIVDGQTAIFADTTNRKVTAILNYHEPSDGFAGTDVSINGDDNHTKDPGPARPFSAQWGDFRASYAFPLSRQWKAWTAINDKPLGQAALAHFLEDNIRDIADRNSVDVNDSLKTLIERLNLHLGSPNRLLETARGMEIRSTEKVRQAINTDTGEQVIVYEQEHAGGGNPTLTEIKVPTAFLLTVPVFQNDAPYLLLCRLRYRKADIGVVWIITVQAVEAALEDAFNRGCQAIVEGTNVPLFYSEEPKGVNP